MTSIGDPINFGALKDCSKAYGCTINDLMTCGLSISMKKFMKQNGDDKTKAINIILPANIRWEMYPTAEDVKMENKYAPAQLNCPLHEDQTEALKLVKRETKGLKNQFGMIYFMYLLALTLNYFLPNFIAHRMSDQLSK